MIKRGRIFILGAGFSIGAGIPLTKELLASALEEMKNDNNYLYETIQSWKNLFVDVHGIHSGEFSWLCTQLDMEEVLQHGGGDRWNEHGSREKNILRFYLSKVIVERTPKDDQIPNLYLNFANILNPTDIVVTFNWDCLLEAALEKVGKMYSYCADIQPEPTDIRIAKLHGSVNWQLYKAPDIGVKWKKLGWEELFEDIPNLYMSNALSEDLFKLKNLSKGLVPFVVLPGYAKSHETRLISPLWYKAGSIFSPSKEVIIIGLSLAKDDFYLKGLLGAYLHAQEYKDMKVTIINPDKKIRTNYGFLKKEFKGNFNVYNEEFSSEHLDKFI